MLDNFPTKIIIYWPKNIYPCGMWIDHVLYKLNTEKVKCSTGIPPWVNHYVNNL